MTGREIRSIPSRSAVFGSEGAGSPGPRWLAVGLDVARGLRRRLRLVRATSSPTPNGVHAFEHGGSRGEWPRIDDTNERRNRGTRGSGTDAERGLRGRADPIDRRGHGGARKRPVGLRRPDRGRRQDDRPRRAGVLRLRRWVRTWRVGHGRRRASEGLDPDGVAVEATSPRGRSASSMSTTARRRCSDSWTGGGRGARCFPGSHSGSCSAAVATGSPNSVATGRPT